MNGYARQFWKELKESTHICFWIWTSYTNTPSPSPTFSSYSLRIRTKLPGYKDCLSAQTSILEDKSPLLWRKTVKS